MTDTAVSAIATRLSDARSQLGWTLAQAASRAGVSVAHLSRIEKGARQPSISLLIQLARVYRLSLGQLVGEEPRSAYHVVRHDEARVHPGPDGNYASLSGSPGNHLLDALRLDLQPHASTSPDSRHSGEEWLYVLTGEVRFHQAGEAVDLDAGDAVHLNARVAHHLANLGDMEASVLLVSAGSPQVAANGHAVFD